MIYQETDLLFDLAGVIEGDISMPVQIDFNRMVPHQYESDEILTQFLSVFSNITGVWLYQLKEVVEGFDPYKSGEVFISHLSKIIGFPLFEDSGVSLNDKRTQLTTAIQAYKVKGTYRGMRGLLRGMGIVAEIKDMFVKDESSYEDFEQHIIRDWFVGDNGSDLTGYFKSPHFFVNILLTQLYNPGIMESLWNSLQEDRLQSVLNNNRPINTWPYINLLLYFVKSYSRGGLSTYDPNIFSCYIDSRPTVDFKLNSQSLEVSEIMDNSQQKIWDHSSEEVQGSFSPWKHNSTIKNNYSLSRERLNPKKFILGQQNKPFVSFYDSFIGTSADWKNHLPEVNYYKSGVFDYRNFCIVKNGYLELTPHTLEEQYSSCIDLVDQNIDVSFRQYIHFASEGDCLAGINLRRSIIGDSSYAGTHVRFMIETILSGSTTWDKYFRVYSVNPSGTYLESEVSLSNMPSIAAWHDVRIVIRGLFADVYLDGSRIISNVDFGGNLDGWVYGTYMSFVAPSIIEGYRPWIKDLQVIRLGNQDQSFNFDDNEVIVRDRFYDGESVVQLDGRMPDVSLYGKTWVDPNHIWSVDSYSPELRNYDMLYPQSTAYIDLIETNLKVSFKFAISKTGTQITLVGCNVLQGYNEQYNEHIKVVVDRQVDPNGYLRICKYRKGFMGEVSDQLIETLASTALIDVSTIDYGDIQRFNKLEVYLTDNSVRAVLNDNWEVSYSDLKSRGNFHTRFGFYKKDSGIWGVFSELEVTRCGLDNYYNSAIAGSYLSNTFDTSGVLLKNYIPAVTLLQDVWHDSQDAFITGYDGTYHYLTLNSTDITKILQSYIDLGLSGFEVDFRMVYPSLSYGDDLRAGLLLFKNNNTQNSINIYLQATPGTLALFLSENYYRTVGYTYDFISLPVTGVGLCGFRARVERLHGSGEGGHFQSIFTVSIWGYSTVSGSLVETFMGVYNVSDISYSTLLSFWWDDLHSTLSPKITSLVVTPIVTKSKIYSDSDKYFGSLSIFPKFVNPTGNGLLGEYFDDIHFTNLVLSRTDSDINFNWGSESPDPLLNSDSFSVRWTGYFKVIYSETYKFYTTSDDGVRLWVNDILVIDDWTNHAVTENCGTVDLKAGVAYKVRLDYYDNTGLSIIKLECESLSSTRHVVSVDELYTPDSVVKGHYVEASVPVNENMDGSSEIGLYAADGQTLVGGVTYPSVDKVSGEKFSINGDIFYQS
jgi:hypothetical protein